MRRAILNGFALGNHGFPGRAHDLSLNQWIGDVSLQGLAEALDGALTLHQEYPANRGLLQGKTGSAPLFVHPEEFPSLQERFTSSLSLQGQPLLLMADMQWVLHSASAEGGELKAIVNRGKSQAGMWGSMALMLRARTLDFKRTT